jgi:FSR family fosmidomycin resistance protein-like MFS transporter
MKTSPPVRPLATAAGLGLIHALVDAATVGTVYAEVSADRLSFDAVVRLVVFYNALAFGLQLPLGWLADRFRAYRPAAVAGLVLTLIGVGIGALEPHAATALTGAGNALYHVGAGAIVLRQWPGRAAGPGLFVAPGALGLAAGIQLGLAGFPCREGLLLALAAAAGMLACVRLPVPQPPASDTNRSARRILAIAVILLFVSVASRSLVGDFLAGPWRGTAVAWFLMAAAVAGKALGGAAADRWGWKIVPVAALLLMVPCLGGAAGAAPVAVLGMLLLQTTMAVTLAAMGVALPKRPGVAFGLPSLALLLGSVPSFAGIVPRGDPGLILWALPPAAALMIYVGLGFIRSGRGSRAPASDNDAPLETAEAGLAAPVSR